MSSSISSSMSTSSSISSSTPAAPVIYSIPYDIFSMIIVIITAAIGGLAISLLAGWHIEKKFCIPAFTTP